MKNQTKDFYDSLADDYHLIYLDWDKSVKKQGKILNHLIRKSGVKPSASVLDCSCGIGTQAIGLALNGYKVKATDLSPNSIIRAKKESNKFGIKIEFETIEFEKLRYNLKSKFDVTITCDNSLPHLLNDRSLYKALHSIYSTLKDGGLFLASIRDYDSILKNKPTITQPTIFGENERKNISFQEWTWENSRPIYYLNHYIAKRINGKWTFNCRSSKYKAWKRNELSQHLLAVGFTKIKWHMPDETGFYQPIVTATK